MKTTPFAVAAALALAACGGDDTAAPTTTPPAVETVGTAVGTAFNDADIEFAEGMIPHHEQAVEMAAIVLDAARAARPEVVDVAKRIQAAQDPEITSMTGWLASWGRPIEMDMGGHDMAGMAGIMSDEDMIALAALTGTEFDQRWMEMMIEHHEGAVTMAETVRAQGISTEVSELASRIITAQRAEIDEMRSLLEI